MSRASILRNEILPILERDPGLSAPRRTWRSCAGPATTPARRRDRREPRAASAGRAPRCGNVPGRETRSAWSSSCSRTTENVYMHGTPAQALFSRSRRDFSHGCVRVEDPVALAEWVLKDRAGVDPRPHRGGDGGHAVGPCDAVAADSGDPVLHHGRGHAGGRARSTLPRTSTATTRGSTGPWQDGAFPGERFPITEGMGITSIASEASNMSDDAVPGALVQVASRDGMEFRSDNRDLPAPPGPSRVLRRTTSHPRS